MNLCLQPLACVILKLGMIKVAVSNWSSKKPMMKLLHFESHMIMFFCLDEKGPFLNLKKSCIINGLRLTIDFAAQKRSFSVLKTFRKRQTKPVFFFTPGNPIISYLVY